MNRLKYILAISCLLIISSGTLFAIDGLEHSKYDWNKSPVLSKYTTSDTNVAIIYLKNFESHEFIDEGNDIREYVLIHKRIKVFTDQGIERFNKLYLPVSEDRAFIIEKARVINSKGEIIELRKEDIKEGVDEETERKFRYFALEGIDKGSEIEYIYMYSRIPRIKGIIQYVQTKELQFDYAFEMITPNRLKMVFKLYNDDKKFESDTSSVLKENKKVRWSIAYDSIVGLTSERSAAYDASLIYFGYKLSANYSSQAKDLYSYGELSKLVYSNYHEGINKNDLKFVKKLAKKIDIPNNATDRQTIRSIEEYVKSNIRIIDATFQGEISMQNLWEIKMFPKGKAMLLFVELFDIFEVNYQIGLTSDRYDIKFDPDFELWTFANEFIIYFPSVNDYTTLDTYERLGFFDYGFMNNYGLFVKRVEIAGDKYGVGHIQLIPKNDYTNSGDTLIVEVDFKKQEFTDTEYTIYHSVSGYKAEYIQPYYKEIDEVEKQKEYKESLLTFLDDDGEVLEFEVQNLDIAYYGLAPVISKGILQSNKFFEKARDNYLFKVGELIGPQMEMYSTEKRQLPVEEYYTRHYDRTLIFTIPDGYSAKNLENLKIDQSYENEKGESVMGFHSSYTVEGDKVTVKISEFYKEVVFPVEIYEDYQRVVNAAADFNKVVVIFNKEG